MQFSKFVVTLIVALTVLFTVAVLYIFLTVGSEPVVLIGAWFAFVTSELFFLMAIKRGEKDEEEECEDDEDCEDEDYYEGI